MLHVEFWTWLAIIFCICFVLCCCCCCFSVCCRWFCWKKKESNIQPPPHHILDQRIMDFQSERTLSNVPTFPNAPPYSAPNRNNIFKISIDEALPTYEEAMEVHYKELLSKREPNACFQYK